MRLLRILALTGCALLTLSPSHDSRAQAPMPRSKAISSELARKLSDFNAGQAAFGEANLNQAITLIGERWGGLFQTGTNKQQETSIRRPFAEYESTGTLFFSGFTHFGSRAIKEALLRELPSGVNAVIYTRNSLTAQTAKNWAHSVAPHTPAEVITIPLSGEHFWSRDALPVPILSRTDESASDETLKVVDARYVHRFEPDEVIARGFDAPILKHSYYFEGGNFVADDKGNCFIVDWLHARKIPESVFNTLYGCTTLTRLPFVAGIGHADERVKILSPGLAVTDTPSYVPLLESKGFEVRVLPRLYPQSRTRTYVNSLLINGTLFLPVFELPTDDEAIRIYEQAGFKVVPLDSRSLSDGGMGSIHCITMTYPSAEFRLE